MNNTQKEIQLYNQTANMYKLVSDAIYSIENGDDCLYSPDQLDLYIGRLQANLKKLCGTMFFDNPNVARWIDDAAAFKDAVGRIRGYDALEAAAPWITKTYNAAVSKSSSPNLKSRRLTPDDTRRFIGRITSGDSIRRYKNKINALAMRSMTDAMLVKLVNSVLFSSNSTPLSESLTYGNDRLSLHEGFFNPYDMDDDDDRKKIRIEPAVKKPGIVKNVRMWKSNRRDKTVYKNGRMYAGRLYSADDIVDECPVYELSTSDLYSPRIRDIAILIDPETRRYGVPMGMANYYRTSDETGTKPNIDYVYNPDEGIIRIYATRKIRIGDELVMKSDMPEYENGMKDYQFRY